MNKGTRYEADGLRTWAVTARLAFVIVLMFVVSALAPMARADGEASIWTDKDAYQAGETVYINGTGFFTDTEVAMKVILPDGSESNWTTLSDSSGAIATSYQLDAMTGKYNVEATDGTNSASTTFSDAFTIDFRQCANEDPTLGSCHWINSILNPGNSAYVEGNSVNQRLILGDTGNGAIPSDPTNTHTVKFHVDFTKGGIHANDFITGYADLGNGPGITSLNPCGPAIGPPGDLDTQCTAIRGGSTTYYKDVEIPDDQYVDTNDGAVSTRIGAFETAYGNRFIRIWGDQSITSACFADYDTGSCLSMTSTLKHTGSDTGDSTVYYALKWVSSSNMVLIEMASHLALSGSSAMAWGAGQGASFISGAAYHYQLDQMENPDAAKAADRIISMGSQDNQIQASAVVPPSSITVHKSTQPAQSSQVFDYTTTGVGLGAFSLDTDPSTTTILDTKAFPGLSAGSYSVTETLPSGWSLASLECTSSGGSTFSYDAAKASITLAVGDDVTCTYTNSGFATLTVIKHVVNDDGGTATADGFTLHVKSGGADVAGSPAAGSESGTGYTLAPGTYVVSENTPPTGYVEVGFSGDCDSTGTVTLNPGDSKTCTITNDDVAPRLKLVKTVTNDDGGTATAHAWTLSADGAGGFSDYGDAGVYHDVMAGVAYALGESGPSGYAAGDWVCVGGTQSGSTITLSVGESAVCTINNDDIAPTLKLVKTVTNDDGGTATAHAWTLSADGAGGFSDYGDSGVYHAVTAGVTYDLEESGPSGYTAGAWDCVGGTQSGSTITLSVGESAVCTINNDDVAPTLKLVKVVINNNGGLKEPGDWDLTAAGDDRGFTDAGDSDSFHAVTAGVSYDLSELGPDGYTAGEWDCDGGSQDGNTITLSVGESVVCTITNDDVAPKLTLIKEVINDNGGTAGPDDFGISIDGTPVTSSVAYDVEANTPHAIDEAGLAGYTFVSITGDGCPAALGGTITLDVGESAVCTITNDDEAPSLVLLKDVVNDDGGTATAGQWTLHAVGPTPIFGTTPVTSDPSFEQGTYDLSETDGPSGYTASDWVCSGSGTQVDEDTVSLGLGESLTCTITNDDIAPLLKLVKGVTNDDGGTATEHDWDLTATGDDRGFTDFGDSDAFHSVTAGVSYDLSESGPSGYTAGDWYCIGGTQSGSTITLDVGESATCFIGNDDIAPKLTLIKEVINDDGGLAGPDDFGISIDGTPVTSGVAYEVYANVPHAIDEAGLFGYAFVSLTGAGCPTSLGGTITLDVGQSAVCTITNDDIEPKLTVIKHVVNDDGGLADASDFTLHVGTGGSDVADSPFAGSEAGTTFTLYAGTYTVGEDDFEATIYPPGLLIDYGAAISGACDPTTGDVVLHVGDDLTCTVTNDDLLIRTAYSVIRVVKNTIGGDREFDFEVTVTTGGKDGFPDNPSGPDFSITTVGHTGSFDSGPLIPGKVYTITELVPTGWTLLSYTCDNGEDPQSGVTAPDFDHTVTCTFEDRQNSINIVTDTSYCRFDVDSATDGDQFKLIFLPDPSTGGTSYRLTASNPGQFYDNVLYFDGSESSVNLVVTIPYPFVTQGANPIHVYSGYTYEDNCFTQGTDVTSDYTISGPSYNDQGHAQVVLGDYVPGDFGSTVDITVSGPIPSSEIVYVTVHLDYGLKGTAGYYKDPSCTDKTCTGPALDAYGNVLIPNYYDYPFSFEETVSGDSGSSQVVENKNIFKHDPGFAGLVTDQYGTPVEGVKVEIYKPDHTLLTTVYTDSDGFYSYAYQHKGKPADYTVKLPDYGQSKTVTLKSNAFVLVNFTVTV